VEKYDGRFPFDWKSKYEKEARSRIRSEAIYVSIIFIFSVTLLVLNHRGVLIQLFSSNPTWDSVVKYLAYFSISGLLGGSIFGIKFFYRAVARGNWHMDRLYWRIFSPFVSMIVAFVVGAMVSAGIVATQSQMSNFWAIAFGFFAGYFADEAVGLMYTIATRVFGTTKRE
jgi:hypothetical protein